MCKDLFLTTKRRYDTEAATHKIINACLRLEEEGGEVVEISDWKPEIIKD